MRQPGGTPGLAAKGTDMSLRRRIAALWIALAVLIPARAGADPAAWVDTLAVPDQAVTYMSAFKSGEAFVYIPSRGAVSVSSDFGMSWTSSPRVPTSGGVFEMKDASTGYLAGSDELWRTDDGAASWTRLPPVKLPGQRWKPTQGSDFKGYNLSIGAVQPVGSRLSLGADLTYINERATEGDTTCYGGRSEAVVLTADDRGASGRYRITELGFPGSVDRLGWLNEKVGWALAYEMRRDGKDPCNSSSSRSKRVLITRDGGKTYRGIHICEGAFSQPGEGYCTAVAMPDARTVVIGKTNGWIYISKNRGYGFEEAAQLSPPGLDRTYTHWVSGIEFANSNVGYAIGKGGGAWRTDDGGERWTYEGSSQQTWGIGVGDIAVADAEHAIGGGPNSIVTRSPLP